MPIPLKVLILEDQKVDAELMLRELKKSGFDVQYTIVDNEKDFLAHVDDDRIDLILSDYNMPQFTAIRALQLLKENRVEIPLIVVTGTIGEEEAVETIKKGAADYLIKDRLARLGQAVTKVIEDRRFRQERAQVDERLRQTKDTLETIIQAAPVGILAYDADGKVRMWNKGAERMFGWKQDEVLGKPYPLITDDADEGAQVFSDAIQKGDSISDVQVRRQRKDGSYVVISVSTSPLRDADGSVTGSIAVLVDMSDRRMLEEQLLQAQKMETVGRLAGGIAHDFNNLLTVINGYAELAMGRVPETDPMWVDIEQISKAGEQAAALTNQLLIFSRRQKLQLRTVALNEVVTSMEDMVRRLIGENIEVTLCLQEDIGLVKADPTQLSQVIMNLAANARDAMLTGGKLIIETATIEIDRVFAKRHPSIKPGHYTMLAVSDTGVGMDQETQLKIFEPFFTTKERGKGTGLGLAMVYSIVRQSGGDVLVYSEIGRGTTFKILFPLVTEEAVTQPETPTPLEPLPAQFSGSILIVEDDEVVCRVMRDILRNVGYTVLIAQRGAEAMALAEKNPRKFDLLITDLILPDANGRDLAMTLQKTQGNMHVLYISGYTDEAVYRHGMIESGAPFLQKPFTYKSLTCKIREVMNGAGTKKKQTA